MGRLFDAVSAMLGICTEATYEGQAAVELESEAAGYTPRAEDTEPPEFDLKIVDGALVCDPAPVMRGLNNMTQSGITRGRAAYLFHLSVARMLAEVLRRLSETTGVVDAALSGGVFQNRLLLKLAVPMLHDNGLKVYLNEQVPPNDGGIALGQAYIGGVLLQAERRDNHVRGDIGKAH
jgi:hydrogenase maturation protein HypF